LATSAPYLAKGFSFSILYLFLPSYLDQYIGHRMPIFKM